MALAERLRISPGVPLLLAAFVWLASPLLLGAILSAAVCHELGHWLVLRRVGGRIQRLHITVFGAEMQVDDRRISYGGELLAAAAGPVSNLLLAAALGLLGRWWEPLYLFAGAQLVLGAFNLLPALAAGWRPYPVAGAGVADRTLYRPAGTVGGEPCGVAGSAVGGRRAHLAAGGQPLFAGGGRGADRMESAGNKACQRGIKRVK